MCMALALFARKLGVGIHSSLLGPPTTGQLATAKLPYWVGGFFTFRVERVGLFESWARSQLV
jgi:hypothetical protein